MVRAETHRDVEEMLLSLVPRWFSEAPDNASERDARRRVAAAFERALEGLTAEERVYLKMWLLHDCTVDEIACAFHQQPTAFRPRFQEILSRTRTLVSRTRPERERDL